MPRKPLTPFGTGLASKIYWCVYVQPNITHRIANTVYGRYAKNNKGERKKVSSSDKSKVTQVIGKLERDGFLKRDENRRYHIVVCNLVSQFEDILRVEKTVLDPLSRSILTSVLNSLITRRHFEMLHPSSVLSEYQNKDVSFITNITSDIACFSLVILRHVKKDQEEKNWLTKKVREHNAQIASTNSNEHPITKEQYFDNYVRSLEEYLLNEIKGKKLLTDVKKEITSVNDFNQNLVALLWNLMLSRIPESVLIKMAKLHKNATTAENYVTLGGRIFKMPRQEAVDHLKSLCRLHVHDDVKFTDSDTNKSRKI